MIDDNKFNELLKQSGVVTKTPTNWYSKIQKPEQPSVASQTMNPSSFIKGASEAVKKTVGEMGETKKSYQQGDIGLPRAALTVAGEGIGGAFDVATELPLIKQGLELFGKGIGALSETSPVKAAGEVVEPMTSKVVNWYQSLSPEDQRAVKAAGNILSVVPVGKGTQVALKEAKVAGKEAGAVIGETVSAAGKTVEVSGKTAAEQQTKAFARELTRPERTNAVKIAEVPRTTEQGFFKKDVVSPTVLEQRMADEVAKVPGISPSNTFQKNYNIVQTANKQAAEELEQAVIANNFMLPRKETISRLKAAQSEVAFSPTVVGDAQVTANRLLDGAIKFVNSNESTGKGLLKAKKEYDAWVLSQKPKAFDGATENAFTLANRQVRNVFKDLLDEKAPNAKVKESLAKQSALYDAMDNIAPKAAKEADTAIGRTMQRIGEKIGSKNKLVQGLAAATGLGAFGAATAYALPLTLAAGAGWVIYQGGKAVLKPAVRTALGKLLQEGGKLLNPAEKTYIQNLLNEYNAMPNKQAGMIKNPFVREEMSKLDPSSPRGRNLSIEAKEALENISDGNPAAREVLQEYLSNPSGSGITRTEVATAIDSLKKKVEMNIVEEAKKYKSAEEFVNNKIDVFHATNEVQARSIESSGYKPSLGRGFSNTPGDFAYFTPSVDGAIRYSKTSSNGLNKITSGHLKGNILKIEGVMPDFEAFGKASRKLGVPLGKDSQGNLSMLDMDGLKKALQENGYSAIEFKDRYSNGARAIAAIPEDVLTKSQLTDIWKKANNITLDEYGTPITKTEAGQMLADPVEGGVWYHGTTELNKQSILKNGINTQLNKKGFAEQPEAFYMADKSEAGMYGGDKFSVGVRVKKGETIKTLSVSSTEWRDIVGKSRNKQETTEALKQLREMGYDAVNAGDEIEVLNPSKFEVFDPEK